MKYLGKMQNNYFHKIDYINRKMLENKLQNHGQEYDLPVILESEWKTVKSDTAR